MTVNILIFHKWKLTFYLLQNNEYQDPSYTWNSEKYPPFSPKQDGTSLVLNYETPLFSVQIPYESVDACNNVIKESEGKL